MGDGMGHPGGFSPLTPGVSAHRCENQELRRMVTLSNQESAKREAAEQQQVWGEHGPQAGLGRGQARYPHGFILALCSLSQWDWCNSSGC